MALIRRALHAWSRQLLIRPAVAVASTSLPLFRSASTADSKESEERELVPERLYSKINVKVKGADYAVLDSYCRFVITAAKALDVVIGGRIALPTRVQKFTVLKSPHIYKKHRVQYEIRTHTRLMQVRQVTGTTADIFLEYIQRNLPEGVSMGVYQERMDTLPALLTAPPDDEPKAEGKLRSQKKAKK